MSNDSRNSALNATAKIKVHHAQLSDIRQYTPEKLGHLHRGGIRSGLGRDEFEAAQMLDKIPPAQRAGIDGRSAANNAKNYLADKDASHVISHNKGGSTQPDNIKWEAKSANRARGDRQMTPREQTQLKVNGQVSNFNGALNAGLHAAPKGAVIGAVTTLPFTMLRNGLRVARGEISAEAAAMAAVKEIAIGGGVGAATTFTVTAVAVACPPIAVALTALSPVLLVGGGALMVYEFFKILDNHKQEVRAYYQSLTQQELARLEEIETELVYEHNKNLTFLAESEELNQSISNRPLEAGIEGALNRYLESASIAKALNVAPSGNTLPRSVPGE